MPSGLWIVSLCTFPCLPPVEVLNTVSAIVDAGSSINLYMFHGGTNFGFMNGAMHFQEYKSDVTSYGKYSATLTLPEHSNIYEAGLSWRALWGPLWHLQCICLWSVWAGKVEVSRLSLLKFQSGGGLRPADRPVSLWA